MAINSIPGSYRAGNTIAAPKVKASEEGLFKPISGKVSGAMTDEYIEKIKSCARQAAASGKNMVESGYAAIRDAQMGKSHFPGLYGTEQCHPRMEIREKHSELVWPALYCQCL